MTEQSSAASDPFVRTVLGDVRPASIGRVNYHEHLFQSTPLLPGEELDDERLSGEEAASLRASGINTMIDATPWGLGRDPEAVARISRETGLGVVATAGFHREAHYQDRPDVLTSTLEAMTRQCVSELTVGQPATDSTVGDAAATAVRAGVLKAGVGYWSITHFERRALAAAAAAHRATGAPVMVHLEHGSCAHEVLDLLVADGVLEHRVVLAHIDRNPDPVFYSELASRGAYLGCDGAARLRDWPESTLIDALGAACSAGHSDRVLLGGDVARRSRYIAYDGMPGLRYLASRFLPRLAARTGEAAIRSFLEENPQRLLAWEAPAGLGGGRTGATS